MANANPAAPRKRRPILRAIGLAVLAFVVVYASFAIYLATRPVVISFDAVQKFRDSLPKPAKADAAAWPAYRDALVASGYVNASGVKDKAVSDAIGAWPGADGWAPVSKWIDANQPALSAARAASKRPVLGFPLAQEPTGADADFFRDAPDLGVLGKDGSNREHFPMFAVSLAHLNSLRGLGMVLQADMLRAVEQGDGERATQDLEAMMALSVHVPEGRLLIGDLVAMAIRGAATRAATASVEWKPQIFTEAQLKRMQAALRSVPPELERIELAAEQLLFEDAVQRLYSDDGQGDGWFVPTGAQLQLFEMARSASGGLGIARPDPRVFATFVAALRPIGAFSVAGRKEAVARCGEVVQAIEAAPTTSPREAEAALDDIDERFDLSGKDPRNAARWFLQWVFMPASGKAAVNFAVDRASREMACVAIAAELFHRQTGRWPASADQLAPLLGGRTPMDPWVAAPVRVVNDDSGFRMWSLARDGQDDGGDVKSITPTGRGDWVFFAPRGNLDRWKAD